MTIQYHYDLEQGTDDWYNTRCGLLTASEMKHIITPAKLQYASNDKERGHLYELAAQRISGYVEPHYISDDMLRGHADEITAKNLYSQRYAKVKDCGFITNDKWGFTLGYSPDGLLAEDGQLECKSRRQKYQVETIIKDAVPEEFIIQLQTGLLVSERGYCDFLSFNGGMPLFKKRVYPDEKIQAAIIEAARTFHQKLDELMAKYRENVRNNKFIATERLKEEEIVI